MTRARKLRIAAVAVAVVLAGVSLANAATLNITGGSLSGAVGTHPCAGTLAATTPTTAVPVSTVTVTPPAACVGRTVAVTVTAGAAVRQGTATAPASGSVTVTLNGAYTPSTSTQVAATASGWHLATSWSYQPWTTPSIVCGTDSGSPCIATFVSLLTVAGGYDMTIRVQDARSGNGNNPEVWWVRLDFGSPTFPTAVSSTSTVRVSSTCADRPLLEVRGESTGRFNQLRRDPPNNVREFNLQVRDTGTGDRLTCP